MTRVLQVIESYGGGSATAMLQFVRSTSEMSHHLLRRVRTSSYTANGEEELFDSVRDMAPGVLGAIRSVRAAVREVEPDVIHAHSSFAGAFVRLGVRNGPTIVYTPHSFAFERRDVSRPKRAAFVAAEAALGLNTDAFAGCSVRETALARRLAPSREAVTVPNIARVVRLPLSRRAPAQVGPPLVCGMGRLGPQHAPDFFADVVRRMREVRGDLRARWIGGGDPADEERLRAAGIELTGWVTQAEVFDHLAAATLYVHSAAWDGAPMALLEANALGVPIVARLTPALTACPQRYLSASARGVADAALRLLTPDAAEANVAAWDRTYATNTPAHQREQLLAVYRSAPDAS